MNLCIFLFVNDGNTTGVLIRKDQIVIKKNSRSQSSNDGIDRASIFTSLFLLYLILSYECNNQAILQNVEAEDSSRSESIETPNKHANSGDEDEGQPAQLDVEIDGLS